MNMDDFKVQSAAIFSSGLFPNPGTGWSTYLEMSPKPIAKPLELANWQGTSAWCVHLI